MYAVAYGTPVARPAPAPTRTATETAASGTAAAEDRGVDVARAFLGVNASYYDEAWRVMAWRGRTWSWNGAAFWFGPLWFAHRRMAGYAAVYVGLVLVLEGLCLAGVPAPLVLAALVGLMGLAGGYGNALYLRRFNRKVRHVNKCPRSIDAYERALGRQGGTEPRLAAAAGIALLAGLALPLFG